GCLKGRGPCQESGRPSRAGTGTGGGPTYGGEPLPRRHAPARGCAAARLRAGRSCQVELVRDRREMALNLGIADRGERRRLPMRRLILVDDARPYPLLEVVPARGAGKYSEFGPHTLGEIEVAAAPRLGERDLEAQGRLGADGGSGGSGEGRVDAACGGRGVESRQHVLDPVPAEEPVDRGATSHHSPLA